MTLMRGFTKVDQDGKIQIPVNIRREAGLSEGQLVEIKITGAAKKKNIIISQKNNTR
jgi:bifunctional DNA-binding transcriptional regulator/antitoxin component of YhaV-PrlF toxin-antitoxin module